MTVLLAVEGETDIEVARKLVESVGLVAEHYVTGHGKHSLDLRIPELNRTGEHLNWLILRDLDKDESCAPALVDRVLKNQALARRVCVRIAERAVESWLLADRDAFATRFRLRQKGILPERPDEIDNPKDFLVKICRQSHDRHVRKAMVPHVGSNQRVGPNYEDMIADFVRDCWLPKRAAKRSPSLERALRRIHAMKAEGRWS